MQKKGIDKKATPRRKNKVYKIKQIDIDKLQREVNTFMHDADIITLLPSWTMFCEHLKNIIQTEFPEKQEIMHKLLDTVVTTANPNDTEFQQALH